MFTCLCHVHIQFYNMVLESSMKNLKTTEMLFLYFWLDLSSVHYQQIVTNAMFDHFTTKCEFLHTSTNLFEAQIVNK